MDVVRRDSKGRVMPGSTLNPGGRPKDASGVAEAARSYAPEALDTLLEVMREAPSHADRARAAVALLDRGYGRPSQSLEGRLEVARDFGAEHLAALIQSNRDCLERDAALRLEKKEPNVADG